MGLSNMSDTNIHITIMPHGKCTDIWEDTMTADEARELLKHDSYAGVATDTREVAPGIPACTTTHYENIFAKVV